MKHWIEPVREHMSEAIASLQRYCQQPSISAQGIGIMETIEIIKDMIQSAGGSVEVLSDCGGNPVIYGYFEAGPKGNHDKTILFYNHYDVQPPEPLDEWSFPPFGAEIHDGKLYARGAGDNKADLTARIQAVSLLQKKGGLPCNVKFMIEGEEEIGSPSLEAYLEKYAHRFAADACIWETYGRTADETVEMVAGIKGICYLQLWCHSADVDLHSSLGAIVDNAAWRLTQALATMRTIDNRIIVEGFYDDVIPPSDAVIDMAKKIPVRTDAMIDTYGLKRPFITGDQHPNVALVCEPTMSICGIESGYAGEGSKTVLPKRAQAKIDCRLVPNQKPLDIYKKVRAHLDKHGFTDIEVELLSSGKAYRSDVTHPFVQTVIETAREAYQADVELWPNAEGSGPMYIFGDYLGKDLPIVSTGCVWWGCRAHAPDESIRIKDFEEGIHHIILLLERFSVS